MKNFRTIFIFLINYFNCQIINNLRKNYNNNDLKEKEKEKKKLSLYIGLTTFIFFIFFISILVVLYIKVILKEKRKKQLLNKYKKHYFLQEIIKPSIYKNNILIQDGVDLCPICLQNLLSEISKIFITNCKHVFHFYCFKKYILSSSLCECPICKFNFYSFIDEKKIDIEQLKPIKLDENDNPEFEIKRQNMTLKENGSKSTVNFYYNY